MPANLLAVAVERYHIPIIEAKRMGVSLFTMESPMGERQISPMVWMK